MHIHVYETPEQLGKAAAAQIADLLRNAIAQNGEARLLLSTGASQFEMFRALIQQTLPWERVTMFHLDEYIALPSTHPASFRKYLRERFLAYVPLKNVYWVDGEGDVPQTLAALNKAVSETAVDVGVIGIGENGHVAFNDPPADFETTEPFRVVTLDRRCREQQVNEGWFASPDAVPEQAISMSVRQILSCRSIVSVVPHKVKAQAVQNTLTKPLSPQIPATALKTHPNWDLYLDTASAAAMFAL